MALTVSQDDLREKAREIRRSGNTPAWVCSCKRIDSDISQRAHLAQLRRRGKLGTHRTVDITAEPIPIRVRQPAHNDAGMMLEIPGLLEIPEAKLRQFVSLIDFPPLSQWLTACWGWRGWRKGNGYGRFYIRHNRAKGERALNPYAHRLSYTIFRGPIPEGDELDHDAVCGNKWCINPWHVEPVDHGTNIDRRNEDNGYKTAEDPNEILF